MKSSGIVKTAVGAAEPVRGLYLGGHKIKISLDFSFRNLYNIFIELREERKVFKQQ